MSERSSYRYGIADQVAPYLPADARGGRVKLSISLPAELLELVRSAAVATNTSVSAVIAAAVRRTLEDADQARLDAALELDAAENLDWAARSAATTSHLLTDVEW